jgi:hypothetical protein
MAGYHQDLQRIAEDTLDLCEAILACAYRQGWLTSDECAHMSGWVNTIRDTRGPRLDR